MGLRRSQWEPMPLRMRAFLWTSHAVQGGAGAEVDWYEIDVVRGQTFQTGVVSDPDLFVYNAGISSDRNAGAKKFGSNMVVGSVLRARTRSRRPRWSQSLGRVPSRAS